MVKFFAMKFCSSDSSVPDIRKLLNIIYVTQIKQHKILLFYSLRERHNNYKKSFYLFVEE